MAITTLDQLAAAAKYQLPFYTASVTTVAGVPYSLWLANGIVPAVRAAPGAAAVPGKVLAGFGTWPDATSPVKTYLNTVMLQGVNTGMLHVYDRLSHMGGLSGTSTAAQTVNTAAITRGGPAEDTTGKNVEGFLEWYSATGGTGATATVSWTDDGGTSGRSTAITLAATRPASFLAPISLVTGTTGIRSVQTVTLSASTGTAGNFGVTLARRICSIPITAANVGTILDPITSGLIPIDNDACLWFVYQSSTTSSGILSGLITLAQG
jgi:hypothetical protein